MGQQNHPFQRRDDDPFRLLYSNPPPFSQPLLIFRSVPHVSCVLCTHYWIDIPVSFEHQAASARKVSAKRLQSTFKTTARVNQRPIHGVCVIANLLQIHRVSCSYSAIDPDPRTRMSFVNIACNEKWLTEKSEQYNPHLIKIRQCHIQ
jgi:hypothetical protein